MRQCISSLMAKIKHLWRTLKEYVCKIPSSKDRDCQITLDLNSDGNPEVEIHLSSDADITKEDTNVEGEKQG